jgi:ankyrin repeat protein
MHAAQNGHIECTRRLLATTNIDVNAMNDKGMTAVIYSVDNHHAVILSLLIAHKADVNATTNRVTALKSACKYGYIDCVQLLLAVDGIQVDNALMYAAIKNNNNACIRLLLDVDGVDVNAKTYKEQKTALMLATELGHIDGVRQLLAAANMDVNAKDANGWTALMFAVAPKEHTDILQLLIESKADVNAVRVVIMSKQN